MGDVFLRQRGALSRVTCIIDKSQRYERSSVDSSRALLGRCTLLLQVMELFANRGQQDMQRVI